jgi:hypothetical protein
VPVAIWLGRATLELLFGTGQTLLARRMAGRGRGRGATAKAKASAKKVARRAAVKTPVVEPTTTLERELQTEAKPVRVLRRQDSGSTIKKMLIDNFKGFTHEQIYMRMVEGSCLYERLRQDKKKWAAGEFTMGPYYYRDLRKLFESSTSPNNTIAILNPNDEEDDGLTDAVDALRAHNSKTEQLLAGGIEYDQSLPTEHEKVPLGSYLGSYRVLTGSFRVLMGLVLWSI